MTEPGKLTIINLEIDDVSLASLGAKTAIILSAVLGGIQNSFLVKKIKYMLRFSGANNEDELVAVMVAPSNASLPELAAALTTGNTIGPNDRTLSLADDNIWNVWQKTVRVFKHAGLVGVTAATDIHELLETVSLGKGMVAREDEGISIVAMNIANNAMAASSQIVTGIVQLWGVWLRD